MKDKEGLQIKTEFLDKDGQIMLLKPIGFIDQSNADMLEKTIANGLESKCYKLIFDLGGLVYMSSAGWGILIGEIKRFRQYGGDLKLVNMNSDLFGVYQMLEFYHIISEYSTINEAMKSFSEDSDFKITDSKPTIQVESKSSESTNKSKDETRSESIGESKTKDRIKNKGKTRSKGKSETDGQANGEEKNNSKTAMETFDEANSQLDQLGNHKDLKDEAEDAEPFEIEREIEIEFDDNSQEDIEFQSKDLEVSDNNGYVEFNPLVYERKVDVKILPLPEKVRRVVSQFPHLGPSKIRKLLRHPDFGNVKVGYFRLRSLLRELDLNTKEKRFRFYRST